MTLNENILDKLSDKIGRNVRTPAGATALALDLETKYRQNSPSVNTVKRLIGILPERNPHLTTLNIIANFLGYPDWTILEEDSRAEGSGFGKTDIFIDMSKIEVGSEVEVAWKPDRRLLLRHDGGGKYSVISSENCKLLPDDLLSLSRLAIGYPFVADKVFRKDRPLGTYRAADGSALNLLNIGEQGHTACAYACET